MTHGLVVCTVTLKGTHDSVYPHAIQFDEKQTLNDSYY